MLYKIMSSFDTAMKWLVESMGTFFWYATTLCEEEVEE